LQPEGGELEDGLVGREEKKLATATNLKNRWVGGETEKHRKITQGNFFLREID